MLPVLQAERQLAAIEAAAVPHTTKQAARDIFSRLRRQLGESTRPRPATTADLEMLGIQVEQPDS